MNIEEIKIMRDTLNKCIEQNEQIELFKESKLSLQDKLEKSLKAYADLEKEDDAVNEDNNNLRSENADLHNELTDLRIEHESTLKKLTDTVMMLEEMWKCCSEIEWESQLDGDRAGAMARRIKDFSDKQGFTRSLTPDGKWTIK